jgi:Flp pilus assembly protein TadD
MLAVLTVGCSSAGTPSADPAAQLRFGVDMARRGLWNEAVFRFEQARRDRPSDAKVLNDLAVAYEAVGRFEDALATYKEAIRLAPGERDLKSNYARFVEFYQSFKGGKLLEGKRDRSAEGADGKGER